MQKNKNKVVCTFIIVITLMMSTTFANEEISIKFHDVESGNWAENAIMQLHALKITDGIGNNEFGVGKPITRAEFMTYLVRLMKWEPYNPTQGSFSDNMDVTQWYYSFIETGLSKGVVDQSSTLFRPQEPITREEMAVMLINTLGYNTLAKQLDKNSSPFLDVTSHIGHITLAKDFGMITGIDEYHFQPKSTAKREEAAVMMMRMYEKQSQSLKELHGFYAISSSKQSHMMEELDSVSFGWSRLAFNETSQTPFLNMTNANGNEFMVPQGFQEPVQKAKDNGASTQLMIFCDDQKILQKVLSDPAMRTEIINQIILQLNATVRDGNTVMFEGVTIDFEAMRGDELKRFFNDFLGELKTALLKQGKHLYVAVNPATKPGQAYYNAYDFRTIGEHADKVILMAHDYYAKKLTQEEMDRGYTVTPMTPIENIYYALKAITDKDSGIRDTSKLLLQISFDSVQWKLKDGKVINEYPYHPSYEAIQNKLLTDVERSYGVTSKNPFIQYQDEEDGTDNMIWYEDSRSIQIKIDIAKMFGVNGLSLWRLGLIPDYVDITDKENYLNVWNEILDNQNKL